MSAQTIFVLTFTVVVTSLLAWGLFSLKKRRPHLYESRLGLVQAFGWFVDLFRALS
jgi:hypothetical protein